MTKLYLVRHGETVDNVNRIMQGQTHGKLTDKGREQARELADVMAGNDIDVFVSSDLQRALDTCSIIAGDRKVFITELLRERDWGDFTGRYIPDLKGLDFPDNVETLDAMLARAAAFLDYIRDNYPDKTVLAVGHGIINKAVQAVFYGKRMNEITPMNNAEVRKLQL